MRERRHVRLAQPVVPLERRLARRAHGRRDAGRLRLAAVGAGRLHARRGCGRASAAPPACPRPGARPAAGRRRAAGRPTSCSSARWRAPAAATRSAAARRWRCNCTMCHGAQGMSGSDAPNLAGQYPEVVIKQLQDYKTRQARAARSWRRSARQPVRPRHRRPRRLLRVAAEGAHRADDLRRTAAGAGAGRRPAAQHRALHLLPRRRRPEARRAVARGHAEGLSRRAAAGLRVGRAAQRLARRRCATWRGR